MACTNVCEPCVPLSVALFYYTLGNISPMYRSTMKCIQLLAVMKSSVLQNYGADVILEPVMKAVKQLEQASHVHVQCRLRFMVNNVVLVYTYRVMALPFTLMEPSTNSMAVLL